MLAHLLMKSTKNGKDSNSKKALKDATETIKSALGEFLVKRVVPGGIYGSLGILSEPKK